VTNKVILSKFYSTNALLFIALIYSFFLLFACTSTETTQKKVVAKVGEVNLYLSEIKSLTIPYKNKSDSLDFVDNYIENWVKSQLFLNKADEFLPDQKKDIYQQIEDYRKSLLTFSYEQELITKNVNTKVSVDEISTHYKNYKNNFKLAESIIKTRYLVVENDIITLDSIKAWIKSNRLIAKEQFENAAISLASNFSLGDEWLSFEGFKDKLPDSMPKNKLANKNEFVEYEEDGLLYLLNIVDFGKKGEIAPLEFKQQDIEKIIVNKRKMDYLKRIKDKIYNDAVSKNDFEIYDLDKK